MYITFEHVHKNFGDFKASDDVSFGIEKGKLVALLGPSGSGKQRFCVCLPDWRGRIAATFLLTGGLSMTFPYRKEKSALCFKIMHCFLIIQYTITLLTA